MTTENIQAGATDQVLQLGMSEVSFIKAADNGDDEGPKLPRFQMHAYSGDAINLAWLGKSVIDLEGIDTGVERLPILRNHDHNQIVGHATGIRIENGQVIAEGVISGAGDAAREVTESARNEYPWQASVGGAVLRRENVDAGARVTINGREHVGPLTVVREIRLKEISFVAVGADDTTSARVAAGHAQPTPTPTPTEGQSMNFDDYVAAMGFDPDQLTDQQRESLQAQHRQSNNETGEGDRDSPARLTQTIAQARAEDERIGSITDVVASILAERPGAANRIEALAERAIEANWSAERFQLEAQNSARSYSHVGRNSADQPATPEVLQASLAMACGMNTADLEAEFDENALQMSDDRFRGSLGIAGFLMLMAQEQGFYTPSIKADLDGVIRAAFSNVNTPKILSNTANKLLLRPFMAVEQTWAEISDISRVNDFKSQTRHRLTASLEYEKVGATGELKSAELGEQEFSIKADTYGKIIGISRQNIIDDDLSAFSDVIRMLGRGAALAINKVFWTKFLDNASFYSAGNNNLETGAGTALSLSSLRTVEQTFMDQTDPSGNPLGIDPAMMLVPTALKAQAEEIFNSREVRDTTASKKAGTNNVYAGRFRPIVSRYLSLSSIANSSSTAWYLLANPADLATIEVAFLNGRRQPFVEQANADFNTLGIQMRAYHDFGVELREHRAGVKAAGA